jgi:hypothetical protein
LYFALFSTSGLLTTYFYLWRFQEQKPMRLFHPSIKILFLLAFLFPGSSPVAQPSGILLYPGISLRQHVLAQSTMHEFFAKHWNSAETLACEMRRLELSDSLLPMSFMLRFATRAWRILNDEFESKQEHETLQRELEPIRDECLRILHKQHFADSTRPTRMFLEAGINGFNATLIIRSKPLQALSTGLQSYRTLDSVRALAPQLKDLYLGLGLFQCALANEPGIISFALRLFNRLYVSLDSGLVFLRTCSDSALYTREGAKEYLVQFLSPFKEDEVREKQAVFKSLQSLYPNNAYYVFQEIDEGMAFHRAEVFSGNWYQWVVSRIDDFDTSNFALRRDVNLLRWQCAAIDSAMAGKLHPADFEQKQSYSFYPVFLRAARMRYALDTEKKLSRGQYMKALRHYYHQKDHAYSVLRKSNINPMLREYFLWHMEDGLP